MSKHECLVNQFHIVFVYLSFVNTDFLSFTPHTFDHMLIITFVLFFIHLIISTLLNISMVHYSML
jgi:hypothetical protein